MGALINCYSAVDGYIGRDKSADKSIEYKIIRKTRTVEETAR